MNFLQKNVIKFLEYKIFFKFVLHSWLNKGLECR
jgi:hypothetical protein